MMIVSCYRGARAFIEQPAGSFMPHHPRWQWLLGILQVQLLAVLLPKSFHSCFKQAFKKPFTIILLSSYTLTEVFSGGLWMGKFGGPTPKRHIIFANDQFLDPVFKAGEYLSAKERKSLKGSPLVDRYLDSNGVKRVKGNKNLKKSQCTA